MDLINKKITESDLEGKGVIGMPEVPELSAAEMQRKIEEITRDVVIVKYNALVEWLIAHGATQEDLEGIVINAGAVTEVFGRRGKVKAQKGDYTPEMVGAAAEKHAAEHAPGGKDPLDANAIGAAKEKHNHGNITFDGKIGNVNDKILMTGINGIIEAKEKENSGFMIQPEIVATSGDIAITAENNKEYEYTGVTSFSMAGAKVNCHGIITFANSVSDISITGFLGISGDDIANAKPGETWEFDVFAGRIIWKNWGAE